MRFFKSSLILFAVVVAAPAQADQFETPVEVFDLIEADSHVNQQFRTSYEVVLPVQLKMPKSADEELISQEAIHKQFEAVRGPVANVGK